MEGKYKLICSLVNGEKSGHWYCMAFLRAVQNAPNFAKMAQKYNSLLG